jgi:hypothetical protein
MIARYFARRWGGLAYELVIGLAVVGFLMLAALAVIASVVVLAVIGILGSLVWFAVIPRDVRHGWVLDFRGVRLAGVRPRRVAAHKAPKPTKPAPSLSWMELPAAAKRGPVLEPTACRNSAPDDWARCSSCGSMCVPTSGPSACLFCGVEPA